MRPSAVFGPVLLAALALAACNGGSHGGGGGTPPTSKPTTAPTTSPTGSPTAGFYVYVANATANSVTGYAPLQGTPQITITSGVSSPVALAVDSSGNLYVDNCQPCVPNTGSKSSITAYAQGSGTPALTITAGLSMPVAMAVAANGTLYVANQSSNAVTAYAKGTTTIAMTITKGVALPVALALDASGNIYVANGALFPGTVTVYSPMGSLLRTLSVGGVQSVAVDSAGRVYASNCNASCGNGSNPDNVTVFNANSTTVAYSISTNVKFPTVMGLDTNDNLYVGNAATGGNNVEEYAAGTGAAVRSISAPGPAGIAVDRNNVVYVANGQGPGGVSYNELTEYQNGTIFTVTNGIKTPAAVAVSAPAVAPGARMTRGAVRTAGACAHSSQRLRSLSRPR